MTDKVQRIREKIKMVINRRLNLLNGDYFELNKETDGFTNEIIDIVDSLQEEPVSEDLEEAVNAYIGYAPEVDESSSVYGKRQAFKAGAKWQKEQMMEKGIETTFNVSLPSGLYDKLWVKGCKEGDKLLVIKKDEL